MTQRMHRGMSIPIPVIGHCCPILLSSKIPKRDFRFLNPYRVLRKELGSLILKEPLMTITLDGSSLTIEKVVAIARNNEKVELAPAALERIKICRAMLEEKLANKEVMYGTNTGIGEFSETMLSDEQVKEFQKYLVYNHAAGIGEPAPIEYVRAALAGRINVHAHGNSGCRPEITLTLVEMLNKGLTPVVCQKGSVGASGDLAPMAQAALLLMGEGEAFYKGERLAGHEAMQRAGIAVPGLQARDCLAAINGSNLLTAMSAIHIYDMERFIKQAEIAAARDAIAYARSQVEIELNGVGDNPIFIPEDKLTLTGANFQGTPVSLPMEMAGVAIRWIS